MSPGVTGRRLHPKVTVGVVFVIAMFMTIMDTTIVNVALPTMSRDLSVLGPAAARCARWSPGSLMSRR